MLARELAEGLKKWGFSEPKGAKTDAAASVLPPPRSAGRGGGSETTGTSAGAKSQLKEEIQPPPPQDLSRVCAKSFHCARLASVISSPTHVAGSRRPFGPWLEGLRTTDRPSGGWKTRRPSHASCSPAELRGPAVRWAAVAPVQGSASQCFATRILTGQRSHSGSHGLTVLTARLGCGAVSMARRLGRVG